MAWKFFSNTGQEKQVLAGSGAGYGTSLPASPIDGQEFVLVDSITLPTYQWRFRYNAGSSNTDKWEFVGGSPGNVVVTTAESTTSATYVDLTTAGPLFTVPRSGTYWIDIHSFIIQSGAGGGNGQAGLFKNGTTDLALAAIAFAGGGAGQVSTARLMCAVALTAGDILRLRYLITNGVSTSFSSRRLAVTPIRVS